MATDDTFKPGFFHLYFNSDIQNAETNKLLEFWIKRQQMLIKSIEKTNAAAPQLNALQNTIAVLMYHKKGKKKYAIEMLETLLEENEIYKGRNTLQNLISMYFNLSEGEIPQQASRIEELKSMLSQFESSGEVELARALCESGYFYDFQLREHEDQQSLDKFQKALEYLEEGIKKGGGSGMSQVELTVWRFYVCQVKQTILEFASKKYQGDRDINQKFFADMVDAFEKFYAAASDECSFYKSRLILKLMLTMTIQKENLVSLPDFDTICGSGLLGELWEDLEATMEEALVMSPYDYKIPLTIGKIYSRMKQYDDAEKYILISLDIDSEVNVLAMSALMVIYAKKSKDYSVSRKSRLASEFLMKAYEQGKNMDRILIPPSSLLELANICYHLSVDKSTKPWSVPRRQEKYLKEAVTYNTRALYTKHSLLSGRAHKQLSDCLWLMEEHIEAISHIRNSCEISESQDKLVLNVKNFLTKSSWYLKLRNVEDTQKQTLLDQLPEDLESMWLKASSRDELKQPYLNFAKHTSRQYMEAILENIKCKNSTNSKAFLEWYCKAIVDDQVPHTLVYYAKNILTETYN